MQIVHIFAFLSKIYLLQLKRQFPNTARVVHPVKFVYSMAPTKFVEIAQLGSDHSVRIVILYILMKQGSFSRFILCLLKVRNETSSKWAKKEFLECNTEDEPWKFGMGFSHFSRVFALLKYSISLVTISRIVLVTAFLVSIYQMLLVQSDL